MLTPEELATLGSGCASEASAAHDRVVALVAEAVAEGLRRGSVAEALSMTVALSASVYEALGREPLVGTSTYEREVAAAMRVALRRDADQLARSPRFREVGIGDQSVPMVRMVQGFVSWRARSSRSMGEAARQAYQDQVSRHLPLVLSGREGYEEAVARATRELARVGIGIVRHDGSGRRDRVDVAVRRHVMTQVKQAAADAQQAAFDRLGVELVEVDSHVGARPSHREWQGRVYGLHGRVTVGGVTYQGIEESGAWDGLHEPNCRHGMAPYFPGDARRWSPTPDQDAGLDPDEAYAAEQEQRGNERDIRAAKREAVACRRVGADDTAARLRLGRAQARQRALLRGQRWLKRRPERERVEGAQGVRALRGR